MSIFSLRALGLVLAAGLAITALATEPEEAARRVPVSLRLVGPIAELASNTQWIRYQAARRKGSEGRAISLAQSAIDLAPESTDGWRLLAAYLALDLASPEHEPDRGARRRLFLAGIEVTQSGEGRARRPADLALWRALLYLSRLDVDPELFPGGRDELSQRADEALHEAADLGSTEAKRLLER